MRLPLAAVAVLLVPTVPAGVGPLPFDAASFAPALAASIAEALGPLPFRFEGLGASGTSGSRSPSLATSAAVGVRSGPGCETAAYAVALSGTPGTGFANERRTPARGGPDGVNACGQPWSTGALAVDAPNGATACVAGSTFPAGSACKGGVRSLVLEGHVALVDGGSTTICVPFPLDEEICFTVYVEVAYGGVSGWTGSAAGSTDAALLVVDP